MRVDLLTYGTEPPENRGPSRAGQAPAASAAAAPDGQDQARFSFDQARVQSLEAQVLKQPEIRQQKVGRLEKLVRNGQYAVSADEVAQSMVAELAGAHSGRQRE